MKYLAILAAALFAASAAVAKTPPTIQATFVGTDNVDCLVIKQSGFAVVYGAVTGVKGLPIAVPVPIDRVFPDRKNFTAIKIYKIQVGDKVYDTVPNSKNPLTMIAPGEALTVSMKGTNVFVYSGKKRYKFLALRASKQ